MLNRVIPRLVTTLLVFSCWFGLASLGVVTKLEAAENTNNAKKIKLYGTKVVVIIASHAFNEEEYKVVYEFLKDARVVVRIASSFVPSPLDPWLNLNGVELKVRPDILVKDIEVEEYDAFILVGGLGAQEYFSNKKIHKILQEAAQQNKIIGAIEQAPMVLARAGILEGKKATACKSQARKLNRYKVNFIKDQAVVRNGNIITADGPEASQEFIYAVVQALKDARNKPKSKLVNKYGSKVLLVIARQGFGEDEYQLIRKYLDYRNIDTIVTSSRSSTTPIIAPKSESGKLVVPLDKLVHEIDILRYDACIFIGGPGVIDFLNNYKVRQLIEKANAYNKILGAIGLAQLVLAKTGVLKDKKVAGIPEHKNRLRRYGVIFDEEKKIVQDDNIITAVDAKCTEEFIKLLIKTVEERRAEAIRLDNSSSATAAGMTYAVQVPQSELTYSPSETLPTFFGLTVPEKAIIFVLDRSGSMVLPLQGQIGFGKKKIDIVKHELYYLVRNIPEDRFFNIIFFDDQVMSWKRMLMEATKKNKKEAIKFFWKLEPGGATNLYDALSDALTMFPEAVYLLSDGRSNMGSVIGSASILRAIQANHRGIPIHTICVNRSREHMHFMEALARHSGGRFVRY